MSPQPLTILTVGDGDLSASLAILRAYSTSAQISIEHLVATTLLPSKQALASTYPSSSNVILEELESLCNVTVLFEVDATHLHTHPELKERRFDVILFHYPHLGYNKGITSEEHATLHSSLLAHYFDSARPLLTEHGLVHVCLCSGAVHAWKLHDILQRLDMECVLEMASSRPLLELLVENMRGQPLKEAGNKQRAKKGGGSRKGHWLGRYGYRHQPTFPHKTEFQTNVSSSYHYFVRPKRGEERVKACEYSAANKGASGSRSNLTCAVCGVAFADLESLAAHQRAPALPKTS